MSPEQIHIARTLAGEYLYLTKNDGRVGTFRLVTEQDTGKKFWWSSGGRAWSSSGLLHRIHLRSINGPCIIEVNQLGEDIP